MASSQGTNSPFCQINSAVSMFGEVCPIERRASTQAAKRIRVNRKGADLTQSARRLTYSNVIATMALFVALGGAAVAAGLPKNSVGPKQLKRGAVTAAKIRKAAVTSGKLGAEVGRSPASSAQRGPPGNIGNGAITTPKRGRRSSVIANGVISTNKLATKSSRPRSWPTKR